MEYYTDASALEQYIRDRNIRLLRSFVIWTTAGIVLLYAAAYFAGVDIPLRVYLVVLAILCLLAYFGIRTGIRTLKEFAGMRYVINATSLQSIGQHERNLVLGEVRLIDESNDGTMVIADKSFDNWLSDSRRKDDYYKPYQADVIFIPAATTNYNLLVEQIKAESPRALNSKNGRFTAN